MSDDFTSAIFRHSFYIPKSMFAGHTRGSYTIASEQSRVTTKKLEDAMHRTLNRFYSMGLGFTVTTSPHVVEEVKRIVPRMPTFSEWWWSKPSFHPVTHVEVITTREPAMYMIGRWDVVCHPALEEAIRAVIDSGGDPSQFAEPSSIEGAGREMFHGFVAGIDPAYGSSYSAISIFRQTKVGHKLIGYMVLRNRHKDQILQKLRGFASKIYQFWPKG